jgi:hypothetical protein
MSRFLASLFVALIAKETEPKDDPRVKWVGRGYRGQHYDQQPPSNVQEGYEDPNGDVYWTNTEDEQ